MIFAAFGAAQAIITLRALEQEATLRAAASSITPAAHDFDVIDVEAREVHDAPALPAPVEGAS